ncbi:MAG: hypothetical protein PHP44_10325 [Kiritimatiellae bacterium]|nr:hypothetical protein [Kiritimatiellia bacterium]MDD4736485.1 hypothetical protein [Kiritimatiellia bacterium]
MAEEPSVELSGEFQEGDIIFDCPECGKSLAIDPRGIGLMITCPDCESRIQVPFPEEDEAALAEAIEQAPSSMDYAEALAASQQKVRDQMLALEAVSKRRDYLEKLRVENLECLKTIKQEMVVIQSALDRVSTAIQDNQ